MSNVFDRQYQEVRAEQVALTLSSGKRRDLFACLERASGREVIVLSSPPKPLQRHRARWLPPVETFFSTQRQSVCGNWDGAKIRIPSSWLCYAKHVFKHTRDGDIVLLDNYEFLYVVAAYAAKLFRELVFVLDYEDGKHASDQGWDRLLSGTAEYFGRPLLRGALLAHPALASRLPADLLCELVPGFLRPTQTRMGSRRPDGPVKFLYSGSLDKPRGVDLLLGALPLLPRDGWELHLTGSGPLQPLVVETAADPRWLGRVQYRGMLSSDEHEYLLATCDVAINCQRSSDPISDVTYPSKTFTYLSAGLRLISSTASSVREVLGLACWYYLVESSASLAAVMTRMISDGLPEVPEAALRGMLARYSIEGTTRRLKTFLERIA